MNVVTIASVVAFATLAFGALLAVLLTWLSNVVAAETAAAEQKKANYNPGLTRGHRIPVQADFEDQLKEARKQAAARAAALPRGANLKIGRYGPEQPTAYDGLDSDPLTAVRIAHFHGWPSLRPGAAAAPPPVTAVPAAAARAVAGPPAPARSADDLVPGKDFPYIEITDDMDPAQVRNARIANAKARSAAVKALKEAGAAAPAGEAAAAPVAAQPVAAGGVAATVVPAAAGDVREPVPGVDYPVIEITEDMDPAAVRQARIANAKAKSAAVKVFKEAGGVVAEAAPLAQEMAAVATPVAAAGQDSPPAAAQQAQAIPADIPRPVYVEITADMDPADVRRARIENAKARSAFHKALKEAGIDPATVGK